MQCLKALIQGVISHTTTCIPCASDCQSGSFLLALTQLFVPLSVFLRLRQWTLINTTKCVLFYLIKSAHILTQEFFTLVLFPSPSLPKEPISSQALLLTIRKQARQERRLSSEQKPWCSSVLERKREREMGKNTVEQAAISLLIPQQASVCF